MFKDQYAPAYRYPLGISLLFLAISMTSFLIIRWSYSRLNKVRVEETASWTRDQIDQEIVKDRVRGDHIKTYLYGY
jgi:hypothetical protein